MTQKCQLTNYVIFKFCIFEICWKSVFECFKTKILILQVIRNKFELF